ncbi:regulator of MON1-CCZ1 complex, partial [Diaphorina citri]|uniref:Regulator of MON1-CCZ1 complex n=1 Tax=Diaphorina citri TaxID=121845 RepID=A0A3Q0IQZ3_DIACI
MINGAPNTVELTQHSKGKNNKIYGFEWVNNKEIVFITEQSIEIYDIDVNSMYVKLIKSLSINSHWFVYDYKTKLLLLSTGGNYNNILQPLQLQNCGEINKLSRFEIELHNSVVSPISSQAPSSVSTCKLLLLEEDED